MKRHFECNDTKCMAHNGQECIWTYEDDIDAKHKKVCPHIRELLETAKSSRRKME